LMDIWKPFSALTGEGAIQGLPEPPRGKPQVSRGKSVARFRRMDPG